MKNYKCSVCSKRFGSRQGAEQHIKMKHPTPHVIELGEEPIDCDHYDDDESFASRAVQAEIDRACGISNPDIDWLLP